MSMNEMFDGIKILDIVFQQAYQEVPSQYAVQYVPKGGGFVDYEFFSSVSDAIEFAEEHGYESKA